MRFTKHQLLALILGAGMASTLPAQVAARRANGKQLDSTRVAARLAKRSDTTVATQRLGGRLGMDSSQVAEALARRAAGNSPAAQILAQREKLGLTDDQVARLEALKTAFTSKEMAPADMAKLRDDLAVASRGEVNLNTARAALKKINDAQDDVVIARLEAQNQARAVLNADQQLTFDTAEARRPAAMMMGGGFGGGAMGGGRGGRGGAGGAVGGAAIGGRGRGGRPPTDTLAFR
ncbi:MAG: Spy/CpxP family protein refolding chaperone [Gemmatimonas sp.]